MHGIESHGAANGCEAIEKVKAQLECCPYKAIFMDVDMPIMDGIDATRETLILYKKSSQTQGKSETVPVIVALTANDTKEERTRCLNSGMSIFLSKPPNQSDLNQVIASIFGDIHTIHDQYE